MSLDDRNQELEKQLEHNPIDEQVAALARADSQRRRQIILLALSLLFDFILSILLAVGWHANHELAIRAETNHAAIVRSCETGNDARTKNKQLWDYILALPPSQPPTPEQNKRIADFKVFVNDTFAPRDCTAIK